MRALDQMGNRSIYYASPGDRFSNDKTAASISSGHWGLHDSLHILIAALDELTITKCIGDVVEKYKRRNRIEGFLIRVKEPYSHQMNIPVWNSQKANLLNPALQLWVSGAASDFRKLFVLAFPEQNIEGRVISSVLGRVDIPHSPWNYFRVCQISRRTVALNRQAQKRLASGDQIPGQKVLLSENGSRIRNARPIEIAFMMDIPIFVPEVGRFATEMSNAAATNVRRA